MAPPGALTARARAKINLSLHVLGRREDGYHELESLVAFAGVGDGLALEPGVGLSLTIAGPLGAGLETHDGNLVLIAARNLAALIPDLRTGAFHLVKRLPVASGIGGGSADAAAALRLLARANGIAAGDPRLFEAARATGADVPACLMSRSLVMRGAGERLERADLPGLFAVLVNPGVAVPTAAVFGELGMKRGERARQAPAIQAGAAQLPVIARSFDDEAIQTVDEAETRTGLPRRACRPPRNDGVGMADAAARTAVFTARLATLRNDLEPPAIRLAPIIGEALAALRGQEGCRLARMSGSGATCFALFDDCRASAAAAKRLSRAHPRWWVKATMLG